MAWPRDAPPNICWQRCAHFSKFWSGAQPHICYSAPKPTDRPAVDFTGWPLALGQVPSLAYLRPDDGLDTWLLRARWIGSAGAFDRNHEHAPAM